MHPAGRPGEDAPQGVSKTGLFVWSTHQQEILISETQPDGGRLMVTSSDKGVTKRQLRRVFSMALVLAAGVFLFHTGVLFEVADHMIAAHALLTDNYGPAIAGRALLLATFLVLFITHVIEAATWGLFLWRKGLMPTFTDSVYFSATSITALGYGDVILPSPWRMLGPLVAISGTLMFGCSTAFLFLVLQKVWVQQF
jgi:Ion channel